MEPQEETGKQAVLDLRVQLDNQEWVNVEMQAFPQKGFKRRILYYLARLFAGFLLKGEEYASIYPAYSLVFTDFNMFKSHKPLIHSFSIRSDKHPFFLFSNDLRVTVIELSKFFSKSPETLVDIQSLWCYLLKESGVMDMKSVRILSKKGEEMKMATDHLIMLSKDQKLKLYKEARMMEKADHLAREAYVRDEGIQQGVQQVVLNMLKEQADMDFICKVTGLSEQEINKLKNGS